MFEIIKVLGIIILILAVIKILFCREGTKNKKNPYL